MQMREKVGKSRKTVFFQWLEAPEGRKVGSLKRRVRSQLARWEMKNCAPLWREAHFEVKMYNTSAPDHFWKLRCRKSACRCGAKDISKSKVQKTEGYGALLEVEMSKKCTPLWREAHFEVKMYKTHHVRTTFGGSDVEKVHAVVGQSTFRSQNVKTPGVRTTFGGSDVASLHYTTLQYTTLHSTTLHYTTTTTTQVHSTTLHYTKLHYTTLHNTTLHYTTLHYTTLPSTTVHYITLHHTPLHYNYNYTTTLHYTSLHSTTLNYTTLHFITLNDTAPQIDR